MRIAGYVRVSTEEQAKEGYSLSAQRKTIRDYCKLKGYELINIYADNGISAKDIKHREGLKRLLSDAKEKRFDAIMIWKLSRLTRSLSDLTKISDLFMEFNAGVISCSENFDFSTAAGKMMMNMLGVISEFERNVISENVKLAMEERARSGKRTCNEVLGYNTVGKDLLEVNEKEAEYVRFAANTFLRCKNLTQTANECNLRGYKGKRGRIPQAYSIYIILTRPIYCGYNTLNGKIYKGTHQPIIDKDKYNQIQRLLEIQGMLTGRSRQHKLIIIP